MYFPPSAFRGTPWFSAYCVPSRVCHKRLSHHMFHKENPDMHLPAFLYIRFLSLCFSPAPPLLSHRSPQAHHITGKPPGPALHPPAPQSGSAHLFHMRQEALECRIYDRKSHDGDNEDHSHSSHFPRGL